MRLRVQYNAPVVLTFAFLSLAALALGWATGGWTTLHLFCVYRSPLSDPLTYVRLVGHVLGHAGYAHYLSNMMLLLVVGPPLEESYGSGRLLGCMFITALISGLVQFFLFPGTALLGASGIVFMMHPPLLPVRDARGSHPVDADSVWAVLYLGGEVVRRRHRPGQHLPPDPHRGRSVRRSFGDRHGPKALRQQSPPHSLSKRKAHPAVPASPERRGA